MARQRMKRASKADEAANLGFESKLWAAADKLRGHPAAGITPASSNPGTRCE